MMIEITEALTGVLTIMTIVMVGVITIFTVSLEEDKDKTLTKREKLLLYWVTGFLFLTFIMIATVEITMSI